MRKHKIPCKRGFSLFLALTMCVGLLQLPVSAAEGYTGGPCEHHTEHTAACGYVEAVEGAACTHEHDTACGYAEAEAEVPCDKACTDIDGDGVIDHAGDCAYQAAVEGSPCTHAHNADCGYVKAVAGHDCEFLCAVCLEQPAPEQPILRTARAGEETMTPEQRVERIIELMEKVPYTITKENMAEFGPMLEECDQLMGGDEMVNFGDAEWEYAENSDAFWGAFEKFMPAFEAYKELLAEQGNDGKTLIESQDKGIVLTYADGVLTLEGAGTFIGLLINKQPYTRVAEWNRERPDFIIREVVLRGESAQAPIEINNATIFQDAGLQSLDAEYLKADSYIFEDAFADGASITLKDSELSASVFENSNFGEVVLDGVTFDAESGLYTFSGSSIANLTIQNMERIPAHTFANCEIQGTVDLSGVTWIGRHAFSGTGSPTLTGVSEDAVVEYSDVFATGLDGWSDRVAGILSGRFAMDAPGTAAPIVPEGWTSAKTGANNSTEGLASTQITEEARWSNSGLTEAEVLLQAYFADVQQMDFIFVMDLSNSMSIRDSSSGYSRVNEMQSKLLDVSRELLTSGETYDCEVAFVTFGGDSDPWYPIPWEGPIVTEGTVTSQGFTADADEAAEFITGAEVYNEYTDYGLGLGEALKLAKDNQDRGRSTAVILISDGEPNKGDGKEEADQIKALGVPVFGVLQSVSEKEMENAEAAMKNVCTAGLFFKGNDTEGFSQAVNDAVHNALKTCSFTVDVNPAFTLNAESIKPSVGTVDVSTDGTSLTWTIVGRTFEKHTLNYRLRLNSENGAYPFGTFDTNAGDAQLLVSGLEVNSVETPQLTRTQAMLPHTLTVRYQYTNGTQAAAAVTRTLTEGASYSITSPSINGYSPNRAAVSGVMGSTDLLITVTYSSTGGGGTTPGGGGGGGGRPGTNPTNPGNTTTIGDTEVPLAGDLQLNKTDHFAYIKGYQDGTVRPNAYITRAQVATIFYRLLDETSRVIYFQETNDFTDVTNDYWANKAISTLTNAGIITGFSDGTFRPNAYITRAQFAAIAARFDNVVPGLNNPFTDVAEDYWARDLIAFAADRGWITGNGGKFRPLENITRVEVMDFINNVLERHVDEQGLLENAAKWSDVPVTDPNYYVVEEATNSHDYTRRTEGQLMENWTKLNPDPVWDE